jgi:hypothetical protein
MDVMPACLSRGPEAGMGSARDEICGHWDLDGWRSEEDPL